MDDVSRFYDGLADDYHLIYGGEWDAAVERHGAMLDRVIGTPSDVLDCACGIGTQAIGLALRGHRVTGTDISGASIERARREAARLGANVRFGVADFRDLSGVDGDFDVVLACDNAVPHLLDDGDLARALAAMHAKLRPGGLLLLSTRDYDAALVDRPATTLPAVVPGPPRRLVVRLHDWDPDSPFYTVRIFVLTEGADGWTLAHHAARYRALTRDELTRAVSAAGFEEPTWRPDAFFQPLLTARRARAAS
jgi:glycine/sarcosine N-methyltransferase